MPTLERPANTPPPREASASRAADASPLAPPRIASRAVRALAAVIGGFLFIILGALLLKGPAQISSLVVSSPAELRAIPSLAKLGSVRLAEATHASKPKARRLVVVVPELGGMNEGWRPMLEHLMREPDFVSADWLLWDHKTTYFSRSSGDDLARRLRAAIDARWLATGGYEDVVLVAYSFGSLLMRRAYLLSAGRTLSEPATAPWADSVTHVVMVAGLGRGSDYETHGRWRVLVTLLRKASLLDGRVLSDMLRGSEFIADVRLSWLRHFATPGPRPAVAHLLGTEDGLITRDDNIDVLQFAGAVHIDVPGARHGAVLHPTPEDSAVRYALFREAFRKERLASDRSERSAVPSDSVSDIVFILHGIRAKNAAWPAALADSIQRRLPRALIVRSSYGYLSPLTFVLPDARRRNVRWLVDQYTEALVHHPRARIHVLAHSNGTYLLGDALRRVPSMRFDRVVLVGSVLPPDFPWDALHERGQIGEIVHERARRDLVVGVLCSALRGIGMDDVGSSGVIGFDDARGLRRSTGWYDGGHTAGVRPAQLSRHAQYIASGTWVPLGQETVDGPSASFLRISRLMPWLTGAAALLATIGVVLWAYADAARRRRRLGWAAAVLIVLAVGLDVL